MDMIGELAKRLAEELAPIVDWALSHWAITMAVLALLIFGAGKQRRSHRSWRTHS